MTSPPGTAHRALPFHAAADVASGARTAAQWLRAGKLIAYPTDTVYGFGSAVEPMAIARLRALKGRDVHKPLLLLVTSLGMIRGLGLEVTAAAEQLASRFWPGSLTMILPRLAPGGEDATTTGDGGTAVRWTSHPGAAAIVDALGSPITSTSANRPGLPPALTAAEIVGEWEQAVLDGAVLVLDGGRSPGAEPSTIVDCSRGAPRVVRLGVISLSALHAVVPVIAGDS